MHIDIPETAYEVKQSSVNSVHFDVLLYSIAFLIAFSCDVYTFNYFKIKEISIGIVSTLYKNHLMKPTFQK